MARGFKHGASGTALNFRIIGGTSAPASPKENTIWVNTDQKITGYYFASEQPDAMADGEVWFCTGNNGSVAFDALKKNCLMVYPYYAKQLIGGVLQDVTAKIYQNDQWTVWWDGTLYDKGNEYADITGEWSYITPEGASVGTFEKREESIYASVYMHQGIVISTNRPVDLSQYNTLSINVVDYGDTHGELTFSVIVTPTRGGTAYEDKVAELATRLTGEQTLNVSGLSGKYYVAVVGVAIGAGYRKWFEFNKVRLIV